MTSLPRSSEYLYILRTVLLIGWERGEIKMRLEGFKWGETSAVWGTAPFGDRNSFSVVCATQTNNVFWGGLKDDETKRWSCGVP